MQLPYLLELSSVAVVLGHKAEAMTVQLAKKLYFEWIHEECRVPMEEFLRDGFRVGEYRVSPLEGCISGPEGVAHVQPKVMDVLLCLARRPGEVVARDTILEEVWGGRPTTDDVLTRCISELRHLLGDKTDDPNYVLTIPKRGYRLIAAIDAVAGPPTNDSADPPAGDTVGFIDRHFQDLRKRKVFQTVVGYPVLSWLLVQIIDILWEYLLQPLGAPAWLVPTIVVLLALGYPIAVFLSWALDITPEGMRLAKREQGARPYTGLMIIGAATVAITVGALFAYFNAYDAGALSRSVHDDAQIVAPPVQRSIAVLRFLNISDNPAIGYLGDGLTEELIHELTNLRSMKVAARTSIWPFSTAELHVTEIAQQLKVEKILEGSIRVDGNNVRVTAQLIDEEGFHLWSETYDRNLDDLLAIQKDIASKVVGELGVLLSDESQVRLAQQSTINSVAYDKYLRGRQFLRQPASAESLSKAEAMFNEAIELDNRFPLAYAGLCEAHLASYRLTRATGYFERAEIACHRALTLDGGLAEIYTALGNLYRHFGQYVKAEQEYDAALTINPMLEEANYGLGRAYQGQGRLVEAEETLRRSIVMEPGYWGTYLGLGNFLNRQGRYEESVPYYETVTQLAPGYAGGFINLGSSLHWLGRWGEAEVAWQKSLELETDSLAYQNLGTLYYYQHRFEKAVEMQEKAVDSAPSDHRAWGRLAAAQRYVDDLEDASQRGYGRAIELVVEQLAVNPDESEDLYYLSVYRTNTGDIAGGREAIERSLSLAPESPNAHYFAAILEMRAKNHEKSLFELAKAVELGYSLKLLEADPELDQLHTYREFAQIVRGANR